MATKAATKARSVPMSSETRGHAIKTRRLAQGIKSVRAFAEASGLSRDAITAAEDGKASPATYERLEAWLDAFEAEVGDDEVAASQMVSFRLSGNFGVDVVVSGPVSNINELREAAERLMRGMGEPQ